MARSDQTTRAWYFEMSNSELHRWIQERTGTEFLLQRYRTSSQYTV